MQKRFIHLASYPRSGNTYLRTILWHCFKLPSASVYKQDLLGAKALEDYVGHIEVAPGDLKNWAGKKGIQAVKTHKYPADDRPAIYIVRDGRAACVSLWEFTYRKIPLAQVIEGNHEYGTWANHVAAWRPWERAETLLLRYEDMVGNLPLVLSEISRFLGLKILSDRVPDRNQIADLAVIWVRKQSDWHQFITDGELEVFDRVNGSMMRRLGYAAGAAAG
jgi:hypothetical protein